MIATSFKDETIFAKSVLDAWLCPKYASVERDDTVLEIQT